MRLWLVLLLACVSFPAAAQAEFTDGVLQGDLWMTFQPFLPGELERRTPDNEKLDALLEEMQQVFSGMVYGWSFTYKPLDPARKVEERLDVDLLGRIAGSTGDPKTTRARAVETRLNDETGVLTVTFRYDLLPYESQRRAAWASTNLEPATGTGKSPMVDRLESRLEALRQALKDAVRNLLRPRIYNKPAEIKGEALLREVPRYFMESGRYVCTARFQVRVLSVRPYPVY